MVKKKSQPNSKTKPNMIILFIVGILVGGLAVYAVLSDKGRGSDEANKLGLPDYAYKNQKTLRAYTKAVEYQDMLMYIPCYCGCGIHSGHLSAKNCFLQETGGYDAHGANCEMCIDIVLDSVDMYSEGKSIPEIRSYVESKYGDIGPPTSTPLTPAEADISKAVLPKNFDSISDGLRLTPAGIKWAQFINVKLVQGTSLEPYARNRVEPDSFYWKKIVGMYSADYSENSWIELHDLGSEATVKPRRFEGMDNVVSTRPFVFGHAENVEKVLRIFKNPEAYPTAYETFKPVLENVKDDEVGIALVLVDPSVFADLAYLSLRETAAGTVEKIVVYRVSNISALNMTEYEERATTAKERGFTQYEVKKVDDLLNIKIRGDIGRVLNENV